MAVRYNTGAKSYFAQPPLPSGYGPKFAATDITIPSVDIRDVDKSLYDLFDKEIGFQVSSKDDGGHRSNKKVEIVFEGGEKWALLKNKQQTRDRNNTLVLPLIAIVRTNIKQDVSEDICGRGINQQTGELIIKRRLDSSDRSYQNIINRLLLKNQDNLAVSPVDARQSQLSTLRTIGDLAQDDTVLNGGLLVPNRLNNVYEFLTIPSPQFYTATYTVEMWAQYTSHMNQLMQQLMSSYLPQGNEWRLETAKGYWFIATVESNNFDSKDNTDDFSDEERIIKYNFTVTVKAYEIASKESGQPVPVRRFVSSPEVQFTISSDVQPTPGDIDPFLGADDPTLPLSDGSGRNKRADQREVGATRLYPNLGVQQQDGSTNDPALKSLPRGVQPGSFRKFTGTDKNGNTVTRYVRVVSVNKRTGEVVLAPDAVLGGLDITMVE